MPLSIRLPFKWLGLRLALSSLRVRLMLLVLIVVLPVLGLTLYTHLERRRLAVIEVQDNAMRMTSLAANNLAQFTESTHQLLVALAQIAYTPEDMARCNARLADVLGQSRPYTNLGVVAADGSLLCSGAPLGRQSLANHAWFRRAIQTRSFVVGDYQADPVMGEATFNFAYPILDDASQVPAVIFATLNLPSIEHLASQIQLP
jgi:hypothetical protein